jgi:hypothetical protein
MKCVTELYAIGFLLYFEDTVISFNVTNKQAQYGRIVISFVSQCFLIYSFDLLFIFKSWCCKLSARVVMW